MANRGEPAVAVPPPPPQKIEVLNQGNTDLVEPLTELIGKVTECKNAIPAPPDMSPVVEAINNLDTSTKVTVQLEEVATALKESGNVDTSGIESGIKDLKRSIDRGNEVMRELVTIAKAKRTVGYDSKGRIVEIRVG
jgi:UDP-glucose 6-dehydrogenase